MKQASEKLKTWFQLAETLADLFNPQVEVAIFDGAQRTPLQVFNPLSLESFAEKISSQASSKVSEAYLADGRKVKQTIVWIRAENGHSIGAMRVRYNCSILQAIHDQLSSLLEIGAATNSKTASIVSPIESSWRTHVEECIQFYITEKNLTLGTISRSDKRALVLALYRRGLFDYKEASKFIAEKLDSSRASIYNYLNWATSVSKLHIHQVDAFTDKRFGGNPAGVVLDAEQLSEDMMRQVTREMNLSETAFVLPSVTADMCLRFFTPSGDEVLFCGHSTVGTLYMLAKEKRFNMTTTGNYSFRIETKAGVLPVEIAIREDGGISVSYEAPRINLIKSAISHQELAQILRLSIDQLDVSQPVMYETTNKDLFVAVKDLETLGSIQLDSHLLKDLSKQQDIVALCVLTPNAFDTNHHAHVRVFAPAVGIIEDPFTGSVQGGLVAYLHSNSMVPIEQKTFFIEQGHWIQRPGTVKIELSHSKDESLTENCAAGFSQQTIQYHAKIIAQAVHFFSTEIDLM